MTSIVAACSPVPQGLGGAFVALTDAEGFLPDTEGGADAFAGALLGVRVTRSAQGGKGPRLSARLNEQENSLGDDGPVRLIRRGPSPLQDIQARYPKATLVENRGVAGTPARFDPELEEQIAALDEPDVPLQGGGRLRIDVTAALTAIDLDSGSASEDRRGKSVSQAAFNRAALPELARQIRLRNLSGAILVDFAGLSPQAAGGAGARSPRRPHRRPAAPAPARLHPSGPGGDRAFAHSAAVA